MINKKEQINKFKTNKWLIAFILLIMAILVNSICNLLGLPILHSNPLISLFISLITLVFGGIVALTLFLILLFLIFVYISFCIIIIKSIIDILIKDNTQIENSHTFFAIAIPTVALLYYRPNFYVLLCIVFLTAIYIVLVRFKYNILKYYIPIVYIISLILFLIFTNDISSKQLFPGSYEKVTTDIITQKQGFKFYFFDNIEDNKYKKYEIPQIYDKITNLSHIEGESILLAKKNNKEYLLSYRNKILIDSVDKIYPDYVDEIGCGLCFKLFNNGKYGLYTRNDHNVHSVFEILPIKYDDIKIIYCSSIYPRTFVTTFNNKNTLYIYDEKQEQIKPYLTDFNIIHQESKKPQYDNVNKYLMFNVDGKNQKVYLDFP